jgi:predicted DNA-binding transcriptional regulator AlpA
VIATPRQEESEIQPLLVSAPQAAEMLGMSEATLRRLSAPNGPIPVLRTRSGITAPTKRGKGKAPGPPRYIARYRPADLQAWIDRSLQASSGAPGPPS